jgi:hypothetical protein
VKLLAALGVLAVAAAASQAAGVDETQFRFVRTLTAPAGVPVSFEPDGPLYGHAANGFADLRIVDADGEQVPWRVEPKPEAVAEQQVELVARGRQGNTVTVVTDRGPVRPVVDRAVLQIPDLVFVGRVEVQGSNTGAEGSYARLSSTPIYSVRGAVAARSTTAVFPATDYRYLLFRARGVRDITGVTVARDPEQAPLEPVAATARRSNRARSTVVRLDLGFAKIPVDAIRIRTSTPRYIRQVTVEGSNGGGTYVSLGGGEISRFPGVELSTIELAAEHRYLRVTIQNGDDAPLEGLRVLAQAQPRPLLLSEGFEPPYRLLYGADVPAPTYDFAQLPPAATGFERAETGVLGAEQANALYEAPAEIDTRTFFERHDAIIEVLLVLAALVVAAGGVLAFRRRTAEPDTE